MLFASVKNKKEKRVRRRPIGKSPPLNHDAHEVVGEIPETFRACHGLLQSANPHETVRESIGNPASRIERTFYPQQLSLDSASIKPYLKVPWKS